MRLFKRGDKERPFVPKRQVYWTGRNCETCGAPLLSDPKIERHAEHCDSRRQTFRDRVEVKS